jgi:hypothetical protein
MERKLYTDLGQIEKFQLFLHTRMCDACRMYEKQSRFMDTLLRKQSATPKQTKPALKSLPEDVKSKIIEKLDNL